MAQKQKPPKFDKVWKNYRDPEDRFPAFNHQCAMRTSEALGKAGFNFERYTENTWTSPTGEKLATGAQSLATYLSREIGGVREVTKDSIKGKQGVVFFDNVQGIGGEQFDHIDLWNGAATKSGEYFDGATKVWFWKLPGTK